MRQRVLGENPRSCRSSIRRWRNGVMADSLLRRGRSLLRKEYRQTPDGNCRPERSRQRHTIRRRRIEFNEVLQPMPLRVAAERQALGLSVIWIQMPIADTL